MLPVLLFFPRPVKNQMVDLEDISDYKSISLLAEIILVPFQSTSVSSQHYILVRLYAEVLLLKM